MIVIHKEKISAPADFVMSMLHCIIFLTIAVHSHGKWMKIPLIGKEGKITQKKKTKEKYV